MGQQSGLSGYQTNYCSNGSAMGGIYRPLTPWEQPRPYSHPIKKFSDFKYPDKVVSLFELQFWVVFAGSDQMTNVNYSGIQLTSKGLDFVHNGTANFLMLDGEVKNIKGDTNKDEKIQVWLSF